MRLAAPGLSPVNIDASVGTFFSDHLSQQMNLQGFQVMTSGEIGAVLGLDRQKQLLGCTEDASSCAAELANALGVDGLLLGSVGKFEDIFQLNLKVLSARDAKPLAIYSGQVSGEKAVLEELNRAAVALAAQTLGKLGRTADAPLAAPAQAVTPPPAGVERRNTTKRNAGLWMFVGGSALTVGGVLLAGFAPVNTDESLLGGGMILVGAPVLVVGGILYLVGGQEDVPVTAGVFTVPGGLGLGVAGSLP
ncbi:MAG: hypothetical protein ACYC8T_37780 [Myxococcaceae bacterium]